MKTNTNGSCIQAKHGVLVSCCFLLSSNASICVDEIIVCSSFDNILLLATARVELRVSFNRNLHFISIVESVMFERVKPIDVKPVSYRN
jgi:hypothetical protein